MTKQTYILMVWLLCTSVALAACKEKPEIVEMDRAIKTMTIQQQRVLGEDFEMSIGETLEKGSYQFAQEKISLHSGQAKSKIK